MNLTGGTNYLEIDEEVSISNATKVVKKKSRELVVIVESNGNTVEIPLAGTTINGVAAADLDEIYEFVRPLVFAYVAPV